LLYSTLVRLVELRPAARSRAASPRGSGQALGFALSAVIRAKPGPRQLHLVGELAAHGQTTTSIIQSTPVPARGITLDAQPET
jgi:hypothetical protein